MPRIYQRKTGRASWSDSDLRAALEAVRTTGISVRQAGRMWGISHPVLLRHLHGRVHKPGSKTLGYNKTVLAAEAEQALKRRILAELDRRGARNHGMSMLELRRFVYTDCERHGVPHHFPCGLAGQDWAAGFIRRHPDIPVRRYSRAVKATKKEAVLTMKECPSTDQATAAMKAEENAQASGDNGVGEDDDDGLKITDTETFNTDRYKAFTMLVRHCVDCNLDRMTPISQQPRHKIEEIARACTRQFPEFSEQLCRSRIRSYLKSSRRNGKKHGGVICEKKRSLPSTLTSPAAERLFEQALKLELENQERIAKGLEPIQAPLPSSVAQPIIPLSTLNPEPEPGPGESDMPPPPSLTICGNGNGTAAAATTATATGIGAAAAAASGKMNGTATPVPVTAHQSLTATPTPAGGAVTATNLSCKADTVERQLLAAAAASAASANSAGGIGDVAAAELGVADLSAAGSAAGGASLLPDPVQVQLLSLLMPQLLSCAAGVAQQQGGGSGGANGGSGGVAGMQNFVRECRSVSTFLFAVAEFWEAMLKGPSSTTASAATSCATSTSNMGSHL